MVRKVPYGLGGWAKVEQQVTSLDSGGALSPNEKCPKTAVILRIPFVLIYEGNTYLDTCLCVPAL